MAQSIDVENLLIWTFRDEKASTLDGSFMDATAAYPQDSILRVEQVVQLGGFIKGSGPGARMHQQNQASDAVAVAAVVSKFPHHVQALVVRQAMLASRPQWTVEGRHRFEPRLGWSDDDASGDSFYAKAEQVIETRVEEGEDGRRIVRAIPLTYEEFGRRRMRRVPVMWTPVAERDSPATLAQRSEGLREVYREWADALAEIRDALRYTALMDWALADLLPDREPWAA